MGYQRKRLNGTSKNSLFSKSSENMHLRPPAPKKKKKNKTKSKVNRSNLLEVRKLACVVTAQVLS